MNRVRRERLLTQLCTLTVCVAALVVASQSCLVLSASNCRMYLVSQYDWGRNLGFYLDLEGEKLAELPLILGIADGKGWRFAMYRPPFALDRPYTVRAIVAPSGGKLLLDDKLVSESPGNWQPAPGRIEVSFRPSWATDPGDWIAVVQRVSVVLTRRGKQIQRREFSFGQASTLPVPLQLFEPGQDQFADFTPEAGDTVMMDVTLRFVESDPKRWSPLIDRYGQCRYARWPGKVSSDGELQADIQREETALRKMPPSPDFDQYGGFKRAGWHEHATGFFRVTKRNGYWWLITPEGNPCFYLGVCVCPALSWPPTPVSEREFLFEWLPPRESLWSVAWHRDAWGPEGGTDYVCLHTPNLIRKFGEKDWMDKATSQAVRRLKAWGFSGGGKWGAPAGLVSTPVLNLSSAPRLVRHPDVFDPKVQEAIRRELERQIAPRRDDPLVLGWTVGSEYDEIVTAGEVSDILNNPADTPAKRVLLGYALNDLYGGSLAMLAATWAMEVTDRTSLYESNPKPPGEDLEKLRRFYADRYFDLIYRTVKAIDPHHLYLGNWIVPGWWENEEDWRLIARHCDVISYDRYNRGYHDEQLARLEKEMDKPAFCGEFSFPAWYDGRRGFGRYPCFARDDAEAGELYARWVRDAARDPRCVGVQWFEYRDQPLTGRGPGRGPRLTWGEHFAFGLVTGTDRPKWEMVRRMRKANLQAAKWRLQAARQ